MITDGLGNSYRSKRLYYIRVQKDDAHFKTFLVDLMNNPQIHALTTNELLRPLGSTEVDSMLGAWTGALLGMAICLIPGNDALKDDLSGCGPEKVIIGELTVGEGGISPYAAHNRTASLSISLAPEYQNAGYGAEAINWALNWAFRHSGVHTVRISAYSYNTRAAKLYQKLGFIPEGRRRECIWFDRQWHDDLLFSMTEGEWLQLRQG